MKDIFFTPHTNLDDPKLVDYQDKALRARFDVVKGLIGRVIKGYKVTDLRFFPDTNCINLIASAGKHAMCIRSEIPGRYFTSTDRLVDAISSQLSA